jgi:hypothetical protein
VEDERVEDERRKRTRIDELEKERKETWIPHSNQKIQL